MSAWLLVIAAMAAPAPAEGEEESIPPASRVEATFDDGRPIRTSRERAYVNAIEAAAGDAVVRSGFDEERAVGCRYRLHFVHDQINDYRARITGMEFGECALGEDERMELSGRLKEMGVHYRGFEDVFAETVAIRHCAAPCGVPAVSDRVVRLADAPPIRLSAVGADRLEPSSNHYHHDMMFASCSDWEVDRLGDATRALVPGPEGDAAWALALTLMCGTSPASRRYARDHTPRQVHAFDQMEDDYGSDHFVTREQALAGPFAGWDTGVVLDHGRLHYGYNSGGVCGAGFALRRVGGTWLLVSVSEFCD
jgi:hypothetical protein